MRTEIVARHPAFGEVTFTLDATDAARAFSLWKQIVASAKQWNVVSNSAASSSETPSGNQIEKREPQLAVASREDDWDLNGDSMPFAATKLEAEMEAMIPVVRRTGEQEDAQCWWMQFRVADELIASGRTIMLKDAEGQDTDTFDVVAMWRRERETCPSLWASKWRKKQAQIANPA